jgi:hypothetical protein
VYGPGAPRAAEHRSAPPATQRCVPRWSVPGPHAPPPARARERAPQYAHSRCTRAPCAAPDSSGCRADARAGRPQFRKPLAVTRLRTVGFQQNERLVHLTLPQVPQDWSKQRRFGLASSADHTRPFADALAQLKPIQKHAAVAMQQAQGANQVRTQRAASASSTTRRCSPAHSSTSTSSRQAKLSPVPLR